MTPTPQRRAQFVERRRRGRCRDSGGALVGALLVALGLSGASSGPTTLSAQTSPLEVDLTLPAGTPEAGRRAFVELRCVACHRAPTDATGDLPAPVSDSPGPDLGPRQAALGASLLATSIISPSHQISVDPDDDLAHEVDGVTSPMGDFSRVMTIRQLVDIIAYLESLAVAR